MKKIIISVTIILIIFTGIIFTLINAEKKQLKTDVEKYLNQKGYTSSDIKSVNTYFGRMPFFSAKVKFKDEEHVDYFYLNDGGQIKQFSTPLLDGNRNYDIAKQNFKHLEQ